MSPGIDAPETLLPLDPDRLPRHVAIIMDGNGRWAQQRGLMRVRGHAAGVDSVREVVRLASNLGLRYLTLYAFSEENWQRPTLEIRALMSLLSRFLREEVPELQKNRVALRAMGDLERLPKGIQKELSRTTAATAPNSRMVLTVALSYGGRSEILHAARQLAQDLQSGRVLPQEIDQTLFSRYLYTADIPDPDLLIRTSGEYRLSNFLLWQSAYTELYFTDVHWPDFRQEEFLKALGEYQRRMRRYGLTQEQIEAQNASHSQR